ncbi:MAG: ribonuclease P protein component 1 [Candidatus Aenigmatarchaeota archaeon]
MRNPKNILRHELIGLQCEIIDACNKSQIGLKGRIVDETLKTVMIKDEKKLRIPKKGTVFRLILGKQRVDVNGNFIISRPEDRIKKKFKKW